MTARIVVIALLLACAATPAVAATKQEHAGPRAVIELFRLSIIQKDARTFRTLFYSDAIPWLGVLNAKSLAAVRARRADVPKVQSSDTPSQFIDALATRPARFEEKFNHVAIEGDEDIVTVHFDYGFYVDDTLTNSGRELWQMIRTDAGWKINSVIYSIELPH